jgi:Flp pilus assembly protein TadG
MRRVISRVPGGRTLAPRRGTAAVEFAIAAPVLLLIAFGCTDLGRAIADYVAVSNAARVGAEYGATHAYTSYTYASWQNQVTLQAQQEMQGSNSFNSNLLSVTVSTVPETGNLYLVTVTATYPFSMFTSWPLLPQNFNLTHSVTMQRFR